VKIVKKNMTFMVSYLKILNKSAVLVNEMGTGFLFLPIGNKSIVGQTD
jgi:hypothetical protein